MSFLLPHTQDDSWSCKALIWKDNSSGVLLRSTWDQGQNHFNNTVSQNEKIKYTVGLSYKTIKIYKYIFIFLIVW